MIICDQTSKNGSVTQGLAEESLTYQKQPMTKYTLRARAEYVLWPRIVWRVVEWSGAHAALYGGGTGPRLAATLLFGVSPQPTVLSLFDVSPRPPDL